MLAVIGFGYKALVRIVALRIELNTKLVSRDLTAECISESFLFCFNLSSSFCKLEF